MTDVTPIPPVQTVPYVGVCRTSGCESEDVPLHLELIEGTQVVCGQCGEQITDLTPQQETPTQEGPDT